MQEPDTCDEHIWAMTLSTLYMGLGYKSWIFLALFAHYCMSGVWRCYLEMLVLAAHTDPLDVTRGSLGAV